MPIPDVILIREPEKCIVQSSNHESVELKMLPSNGVPLAEELELARRSGIGCIRKDEHEPPASSVGSIHIVPHRQNGTHTTP